ncbi:MAG: DUF1611 domain-containing protein [Planctomycetes bacterium]|nr:DUF1611 domain-containing protein [Planctomycetota bacterium]
MRKTAAVYTDRRFQTSDAKTAHGLVRGPSRFDVVALLDASGAGCDAGELLDGQRRGIPTFADLDAMLGALPQRPDCFVIGVATSGGVLPPEMRPPILAAIQAGMDVVNGLHEFLADDPAIVAAAARAGVQLIDIRRPRPRKELHFWNGTIRTVRAPRIAVLGTDCALGKRTTCHTLVDACARHGMRAAIVYTGQTGWLQGIEHGFVLDSTPNDFVSGELEHAIVRCDLELTPDVILLEGQSALRNPSGPCGAELLLSGEAKGTILVHAPARHCFEDQEHLGNVIPPITEEIALLGYYGTRVLGLALNHHLLPAAQRLSASAQLQRDTGLPAVYPLLEGADALVPAIRAFVEEHRR